jgi:hypothetical protein
MEGPQLFSEAKSPFVESMTMTQKSRRTSATRDAKPYKIAFFKKYFKDYAAKNENNIV